MGWMADAAITMDAFTGVSIYTSLFYSFNTHVLTCALTANPALAATFPGHHGLLRIHTLPAPNALVPASDRFSTLRGTGTGAGGGENNLGFKCTRKRLVFETVHLDVEGGVGERRTSAPPGASASTSVAAPVSTTAMSAPRVGAAVEVEVEGVPSAEPVQAPVKKSRKRVGFQSDRPEVYDF